MGSGLKILPKHGALLGTAGTNLGIQALTMVTGVFVARLLAPEGRGELAAALLWPAMFATFALAGVNYASALAASKQGVSLPALRGAVALWTVLISALVIVAGWFVLPALLSSDAGSVFNARVYLTYVPVGVLLALLQAIDQGAGNYRYYNSTRILMAVAYSVGVALIWWSGTREVVWFVLALVAANYLTCLYRVGALGWPALGLRLAGGKAVLNLLRDGRTYLLTTTLQIARDNIEKVALLFLLGTTELGLYAIATTSSSLHLTVTKSVNTLVLTRAGMLGGQAARSDIARVFRVMTVVNALLGLALCAVLPFAIRIFFGAAFAGAIHPALLLVLAQFFSSQGGILDEGLKADYKPFAGAVAGIVSLCLFGVIAPFLAQTHGLIGVACAAVVAQAAYALVMVRYFKSGGIVSLAPGRADFELIHRLARESIAPLLRKCNV